MTVPEWVQDAVFYQIFPDRFRNGDPGNDPENVRHWSSEPTRWGFHGGDLQGVIEKFDYLLDLGVNVVYFTPIFQATSNHRYNATDYFTIDAKLGDLRVFQALTELAHRNGVRVILDGVFNHCGRGFFAFNDILENQRNSPYVNWFHIHKFPIDAYSPDSHNDYLAWWKIKSLPKFNTDHPPVRKYLLSVAKYWIEQGADGWRLDVPNEIDDDSFWGEFRQVVKSVNPEAYILGEIWNADPRWVGESHFDGLMNYPVRAAILDLLASGESFIPKFTENMETLANTYPVQNFRSMYVSLGSHDTDRLITHLNDDLQKVRLAFLIQFAFPGAPAIYYGDEIGLKGDKDPGCRGAFPWNKTHWDQGLREWVKQLIAIRKGSAALCRGELRFIKYDYDPNQAVVAFVREEAHSKVLVVVNPSAETRNVEIQARNLGWEEGQFVRSLLSSVEYPISQSIIRISLSPWSGDWLIL